MQIINAVGRGIARVWRFWMADIQKRKSFGGKAVSIGIGLFVIICACSTGLGAMRSTGQAIGIVPTNTPTLPPTATATPGPTNTPEPTRTPEPPQPTRTPKPSVTPEATETVRPTATPFVAPTRNPALRAEGVPPLNKDDCPDAYPIKGNIRNDGTKIYHTTGSSSYRQTDPEICFAYSADAAAQGFRAP